MSVDYQDMSSTGLSNWHAGSCRGGELSSAQACSDTKRTCACCKRCICCECYHVPYACLVPLVVNRSLVLHQLWVCLEFAELMQAQQVMSWGAEGVIVGSALVKALGEAPTPESGLQAMEALAQQLRHATRS